MADNNIFENGWNKYNAYIFGWIMSDGCLLLEGRNKTAYAVRICSNDLDIIEWMHNYMCVGNKIYKQGEKGKLIKYRNQDAIKFMMDNNLTPRKSLTVRFPNIPEEYTRDFIRGYFDGNGSVVIRETQYNTYGQISFTSGSINFLDVLRNVLSECNIDSRLYEDGRTTNGSFYLRVIKRSEIEKLYHYMYDEIEDVPFLKRKKDKFDLLLSAKPKYNIT